jgi:hypothetical protein
MKTALTCHQCHHELSLASSLVHRSDECPHCFADLHCCKMCQFYDSSCYNECRETQADRIVEKSKKNFCDFFTITQSHNKEGEVKVKILSAAEALFKK